MHFDLIIVGGGMVGAGLAAALKDCDLSIALIDARIPDKKDAKLFALNKTTCNFLANIHLWNKLFQNASAIKEVQISKQGKLGSVALHASEIKQDVLGYVVPAFYIEQALNNQLTSQANLTVFRPAKLKKLTQTKDHATLIIERNNEDKQITTNILIGADGTDSTVRNALHIATDVKELHQTAIVFRTTLKRSHHQIAYQRFLQHGAIAMLPLKGDEHHFYCASIWSAETKTAQSLIALSADKFIAHLQKEFGYRLGKLLAISERHAYPLRQITAKSTHSGCTLLIGNAAHTFHPVAAQGFNLAIYEVAILVDQIKLALASSTKMTLTELMKRENHSFQQQISLSVSHWLPEIFAQDTPIFSSLRSSAMLSFDMLPALKKKFLERMMGKINRVPSLLLDRKN